MSKTGISRKLFYVLLILVGLAVSLASLPFNLHYDILCHILLVQHLSWLLIKKICLLCCATSLEHFVLMIKIRRIIARYKWYIISPTRDTLRQYMSGIYQSVSIPYHTLAYPINVSCQLQRVNNLRVKLIIVL